MRTRLSTIAFLLISIFTYAQEAVDSIPTVILLPTDSTAASIDSIPQKAFYNEQHEWPADEVFIIDEEGYGIPVDEWKPDMGVLAIGLLTENVAARIAINNITNKKVMWGPSGYVDGVAFSTSGSSNDRPGRAAQDFAGKENTDKEVDLLFTDEMTLMYLMGSYAFADGAIGYIPSLGELREMFKHKNEINEAIRIVGGTPIRNEWYWSSTQHFLDYRIWTYGGRTEDGSRCFAQIRNGDNEIGRRYGACFLHCRPFGELGEPGRRSDMKRVNVTVDIPTEAELNEFMIDFTVPMKEQIDRYEYREKMREKREARWRSQIR